MTRKEAAMAAYAIAHLQDLRFGPAIVANLLPAMDGMAA